MCSLPDFPGIMATAYWMSLLMVTLYFDRVFSCPDGYTFCADESEQCDFTGTVAYGMGDTYIYQEFDGSIKCSNDVFGDPLPNVEKECCSKDSNFGHWIVDGNAYMKHDGANGCVNKPDECTPDSMTHGQHVIDMDDPKMEIAVQCCTEDGGQAYRRAPMVDPGCVTAASYKEAVALCTQNGLRLCTKEELLTTAFGFKKEGCDHDGPNIKRAVCKDKNQCDFNHHHIWTSSPCSTGNLYFGQKMEGIL